MLLYAKGLQFDGLPTNFFEQRAKDTGLSEKFDLMLFDFFIFVCRNPQATLWIFMQLYLRVHEVHF